MVHAPLRLLLDGSALVANWHWLDRQSQSAACGAAVKADGYGLGAIEVVARLAKAGCRDFLVATWAEAEALGSWSDQLGLSVLHGVGPDDMSAALASPARPVLNNMDQIAKWRETGRPFDVMVDSGINRLGLTPIEASNALEGLSIHTLMSHLACADEDVDSNERQRLLFASVASTVKAQRLSLANSAGICLGGDYLLDLTRPGLALYGGIPRPEAKGSIQPVVRVEAQIVQRRRIEPGDSVGYNATFTARQGHELAIVNIGYADGYLRGFSGTGQARLPQGRAPVLGRVSMDLTALCVDLAPDLREGDWVELDYDLVDASAQSGLSQYELLTGLGARFERRWV